MTSTRAVNAAAFMHMWPSVEDGKTKRTGKSVKGARADLFNANARRSLTGPGIAAGAVLAPFTAGASLFAMRSDKGTAAINITFSDGTAESYTVRPKDLKMANRYVVAFNSYAASLGA